MKKKIVALTAVSILALSACSNKEDSSEVLISTKNGDITKADLYEEMKDAVGVQVIENIVFQKAIENEFKLTDEELKEAIDVYKTSYGQNFKAYLESQGVTEEFFEKNVRAELLHNKLVDSLNVTDEDINAEYEKMKVEIHARHILLDDEKTANEMIKKLEEGADFEELAKKHSTEEVAADTGGDLGWFGTGRMVQPFEDAVFALQVNEISKPVKTSFGYHVIEVLEKRDADIAPLEELKGTIEKKITEKRFEVKLRELLKNINVDIKNDDFKNAFKDYLSANEK